MIVDDETDLCLLLKDYFTKKNFEVYLSHSLAGGREAIALINPDILFLDNNLPDGTGWKIAAEAAVKNPDIYIVLMSAFHPEVPDLPADTHFIVLEKPISLVHLNREFAQI